MRIIKNRRVCFMGTANLRLISQSEFAAHFKINRQKYAAHFAITLYLAEWLRTSDSDSGPSYLGEC